jgi:DNA-binding beta-propeller fold protein YncE
MRDFRRAWRGLPIGLAGLALLPACGLNQQGVPPPHDRIAYPSSALVDPDGRWLYVVNSNSDLRYNNGTLVAVNLDLAAGDRPSGGNATRWSLCPQVDYVRPANDTGDPCCWDRLDHNVLNCDERPYVSVDSTIEIGSFGSGMAFQAFDKCVPGSKDGRLFIGVRGNSSITYVDTGRVNVGGVEQPTFSCRPAGGDREACAVTRTTSTPSGVPTLLPDEPYALAFDKDLNLLYVGHLKGDIAHAGTGGISVFDVSQTGPDQPPIFLRPSGSFLPADGNGFFGVTSLTLNARAIYASSRYVPLVVGVIPVNTTAASCTPSQQGRDVLLLGNGVSFATALPGGGETRGIEFLPPETQRAFVLQRFPPALVGFDIAPGHGNLPSDVLETCTSPTFLQQFDSGEGARLFVTCFESGQIYVFDPYVPRLIGVVDAGRGPAGLAFAPAAPGSAERRAYVVGFGHSNVSVLDLTPGSNTQYHVIQRIGFPSPVPR